MHCIFVSVVTEAELLYEVAKRDYPKGLAKRVTEFLARVEVLPWTSSAAKAYGQLRAACEAAGITLASMDMMIAAHASARQQDAKKRHEGFDPTTPWFVGLACCPHECEAFQSFNNQCEVLLKHQTVGKC